MAAEKLTCTANGWWRRALLAVAVFTIAACGSPKPRPGPNPTRPPEQVVEGPSADLRRVLNEHTIPTVRADGTREPTLLTPLQASAAFGGLVMLIGGVGAVWLWRRADVTVPDRPEGVIRNSAGPPGSFR